MPKDIGPAKSNAPRVTGPTDAAVRVDAERYRFLTETISDVIWTMDLDQAITYVSPSIHAMTGYRVEEVEAMELREILTPASFALARETLLEELRLEYQNEVEPSHSRTLDLEIVLKNGSTLWCEARMSFLRDGRGRPRGVLGVARDISAWRDAQEALAASEERLRRAQRLEAVGQLAGGVAHDFNNLLTVVLGNIELLLRDLPAEDAHRDQLREIHKAADRAAGLTRQLLAFSRRQMMLPEVLDLNAVVTEMAAMVRGLMGENIDLELDLYPALARVTVDPTQIELALVNLALNARDAMPDGGRLVIETSNSYLDSSRATGEFEIHEGHYVLLAVTDSGVGIEPDDQPRIFEPFFTTKEVGRGTGLGLSTVYGIVKQSRGYIFVDSEPNRGSRFEIHLPRTASAAQADRDSADPLPADQEASTVLLVEDESSVRTLARRILEEHGYEVLEAHRAGLALDVLRDVSQPIDLLLTDVIMPGMSGTRLARQARQARPELPILFMSGHNEQMLSHREGLESTGDLLRKPFTPQQLVSAVERCASATDVRDRPDQLTLP